MPKNSDKMSHTVIQLNFKNCSMELKHSRQDWANLGHPVQDINKWMKDSSLGRKLDNLDFCSYFITVKESTFFPTE